MPWCGRCCPKGGKGGAKGGKGGGARRKKKTEDEEEEAMEGDGGGEGGNPRNKYALKPGHSLMDWIRLGASGKVDLTGVGGVPRDVSPQQLAQHASAEDAWLALRGRVYNVTQYMNFHPGGPKELMRGAGSDATELFNKAHAWVNYESILQKCVVGRLRRDSLGASDEFRAALEASSSKPQRLMLPFTPPTSPADLLTPPSPSNTLCDEIPPPRMDWFQQVGSLTLVWYAMSARPAWPGARIHLDDDGKQLSVALILPPMAPLHRLPPEGDCSCNSPGEMQVTVPNMLDVNVNNPTPVVSESRRARRYVFRRTLPAAVEWPPTVQTSRGKLQVTFRKMSPVAWASLEAVSSAPPAGASAPTAPATAGTAGSPSISIPTVDALDESSTPFRFEPLRLVAKQKLTADVHLLVLRGAWRSLDVASVGQNIVVRAEVIGTEMSRRYTPVPPFLHQDFKPPGWEPDCLCLIVKEYITGALSPIITSLIEGDTMEASEVDGYFDPRCLMNAKKIFLLAAGTGITPMLGIISWAQLLPPPIQPHILLVCFNRTAADRIWADQLSRVAESNPSRLQVEHVLSQASSEWSGRRGRVELPLLQELLPPPESQSFVSACGPLGFITTTRGILEELGYTDKQFYLFEG